MAKEEDHSKYVLLIVGGVVIFAVIVLLYGSQPTQTKVGKGGQGLSLGTAYKLEARVKVLCNHWSVNQKDYLTPDDCFETVHIKWRFIEYGDHKDGCASGCARALDKAVKSARDAADLRKVCEDEVCAELAAKGCPDGWYFNEATTDGQCQDIDDDRVFLHQWPDGGTYFFYPAFYIEVTKEGDCFCFGVDKPPWKSATWITGRREVD